MLLSSDLWSQHNKAIADAGVGMCGFALIVGVVTAIVSLLPASNATAPPKLKNREFASVVVTPLGMAVKQGELQGEVPWDQITGVRLIAKAPKLALGSGDAGRGILIKMAGARLRVLDIFDRPLEQMNDRILAIGAERTRSSAFAGPRQLLRGPERLLLCAYRRHLGGSHVAWGCCACWPDWTARSRARGRAGTLRTRTGGLAAMRPNGSASIFWLGRASWEDGPSTSTRRRIDRAIGRSSGRRSTTGPRRTSCDFWPESSMRRRTRSTEPASVRARLHS